MQSDHINLGGLDTVVVERGSASANRPLMIAIHGRGASAEDLIPVLPQVIDGDYIGLFPNGPMSLQLGAWGIGHAWYDLGPDQSSTLHDSRQRLDGLLTEAMTRFNIPAKRTFLSGFSQGAVMTLEVGLRYPTRLAGLIALSGYMPEPDILVQEVRRDPGLQILVAHGKMDDIVPVEAGRLIERELKLLGYPVEYREFPVGHSINYDEMAFIKDWIGTRLNS